MSGTRKKLRLNTAAVSLGCSCRRPRLSIFNPKPKPSNKLYQYDAVTTTTTARTATTTTTATFSDDDARTVRGFGRIGGESVAVEKSSDDPYMDFRRSMLQMILEKEIYAKDELRELLNCFLRLNSPYYHGVIVRAFTEIWNGVYSVKSPAELYV